MRLGSILKSAGKCIGGIFKDIQTHVAPVAVTIVEAIKGLSDAGILSDVATVIGGVLPKAIVTLIQAELPKILADLLAIEGLPANATPDQIKAFTDAIITSFASKSFQEKSELYTKLGVQVYNLIETQVNANPANASLTFAQIVAIIEESYQAYLADQADAAATTVS